MCRLLLIISSQQQAHSCYAPGMIQNSFLSIKAHVGVQNVSSSVATCAQLCFIVQKISSESICPKLVSTLNSCDIHTCIHSQQLRLSEDHFEQLCSDAYDLGAVAEEYEAILEDGQSSHSFTIPPYDTVCSLVSSGLRPHTPPPPPPFTIPPYDTVCSLVSSGLRPPPFTIPPYDTVCSLVSSGLRPPPPPPIHHTPL